MLVCVYNVILFCTQESNRLFATARWPLKESFGVIPLVFPALRSLS